MSSSHTSHSTQNVPVVREPKHPSFHRLGSLCRRDGSQMAHLEEQSSGRGARETAGHACSSDSPVLASRRALLLAADMGPFLRGRAGAPHLLGCLLLYIENSEWVGPGSAGGGARPACDAQGLRPLSDRRSVSFRPGIILSKEYITNLILT